MDEILKSLRACYDASHELYDAIEKAKPALGSGKRFAALEAKIRRRGDVKDPAAIAAMAGRKKYGKKRMARMAARGRKRASKASYDVGG